MRRGKIGVVECVRGPVPIRIIEFKLIRARVVKDSICRR